MPGLAGLVGLTGLAGLAGRSGVGRSAILNGGVHLGLARG